MENKPFTKVIERRAFAYCVFEEIKIPESVIFIGKEAFVFCRNLCDIYIPNNNTYIGGHAFYECKAMSTIFKPGKIVICEDYRIFYKNNGEIELCEYINKDSSYAEVPSEIKGHKVTRIGAYTFENCQSLKTININQKANIISIGDGAFTYTNIESLTIPDGLIYIEESAFSTCYKLKSISIPDSVIQIGAYAFSHCENLESVKLPERIKRIENNTFSECPKLSNITLPFSVEFIGDEAFKCCSNLKNINLPDKINSIGNYAFYLCGLTSVKIP